MSLKTWKAEFYPTPATSRAALRDPIGHSLRKWRGLTKAALKRHELHESGQGGVEITDGKQALEIGEDSCSCCQKWLSNGGCSACPLDALGHCAGPYWHWVDTGNAHPMIRLLQRAKREAGNER